jgi:cytochrome c oxidase subunit 1
MYKFFSYKMSTTLWNSIQRWFFSTNHKDIGTVFSFRISRCVSGTVLSILIRMELAYPEIKFYKEIINFICYYYISCFNYDFFYGYASMIGGFGNWFVPLLIGAPDMLFHV